MHPAFGLARYTAWTRPADDEQATAQTIALMARFIAEDAKDPLIVQAARRAAATARSGPEAVAAVFFFLKRNVRFVEDRELASPLPLGNPTEVLVRPRDLLRMPQPQGDCDDWAMAAAAMLAALGIPTLLVTIAAEPARPDIYTHVYLVALTEHGPIALDPSHGPYPGWRPRAQGKIRIWRTALPAVPASLGSLWQDIAYIGTETFADIAKARWGQPPPGTYIQRGPEGEVFYRQQPGTKFEFPTTQVGGTGLGGWMTAAVLVIVVLLLARAISR